MLGIDSGIITIVIIIAAIALIALVQGYLIPNAQNWFLDSLVKMPYINPYESNSKGMTLYNNLLYPAIAFLIFAMVFSALALMGEEFYLFRQGEGFSIFTKTVMTGIFIMVFPYLWDAYAYTIEGLSKYILNPSNPDNAGESVNWVWAMIGNIPFASPDWGSILGGMFTNTQAVLEGLFRDMFLAVFKALLAFLLILLMFLVGTVRIVLTNILVIGLPIILSLDLLPPFRKVTGKLKDTLIGLSIAPILSSLVMVIGKVVVEENFVVNHADPIQAWIASVAVAFLAILMPTITAPLLGSMVQSVTTVVTGATLGGLYMGTHAVAGLASGVRGAMQQLAGFAEAGMQVPFATRVRTYAKAGFKGLTTGITTGLAQQASEAAKIVGLPTNKQLVEPIIKGHEKAYELGRLTAQELTEQKAGTLVEGMLPYLTLTGKYTDNDIVEAMKYANEIEKLANAKRYENIANDAIKHFRLDPKWVKDKKRFGQIFGEQIKAYKQRPEALASLYNGLKNYDPSKFTSEDLERIIAMRDINRGIVSSKYGIDIPDPAFESVDINRLEIVPKGIETLYGIELAFAKALRDVAEKVENASPLQMFFVNAEASISPPTQAMKQTLLNTLEQYNKHTGAGLDNKTLEEFADKMSLDLARVKPFMISEMFDKISNMINEPENLKEAVRDSLVDVSKEDFELANKLFPNVHIREIWRNTTTKQQ